MTGREHGRHFESLKQLVPFGPPLVIGRVGPALDCDVAGVAGGPQDPVQGIDPRHGPSGLVGGQRGVGRPGPVGQGPQGKPGRQSGGAQGSGRVHAPSISVWYRI